VIAREFKVGDLVRLLYEDDPCGKVVSASGGDYLINGLRLSCFYEVKLKSGRVVYSLDALMEHRSALEELAEQAE